MSEVILLNLVPRIVLYCDMMAESWTNLTRIIVHCLTKAC
jgi:hypothetical protein